MGIMTKVPNGDSGGIIKWRYNGFYEYISVWGFYAKSALLIAICVLSFLNMHGLLVETVTAKPVETVPSEETGARAVTGEVTKSLAVE